MSASDSLALAIALMFTMFVFAYVYDVRLRAKKAEAEPDTHNDLDGTINYGDVLKLLSEKTGVEVTGVRQLGYQRAEILFSHNITNYVAECKIAPDVIYWKRSDMVPLCLAIIDELAKHGATMFSHH